jgi:hypothetical protein
VILTGFILERREDGPLLQLAPGADRCGAQPVRRAAGTARAPTPPWPGGPKERQAAPRRATYPRKACTVTGGNCAASGSASSSRSAARARRPAGPGALRAPLMTVKKVLHQSRRGQSRGPLRDTARHRDSVRLANGYPTMSLCLQRLRSGLPDLGRCR